MIKTGTQIQKFERGEIDILLYALKDRGYTLIAPILRDGAIVYGEITSSDNLPIGWTDEQDAATYTIKHRDDKALFGYVVGPQSWKKFLLLPSMKIFSARLNGKGFIPDNKLGTTSEKKKYAFVGVRSCELNALSVQDRVFKSDKYVDPYYAATRAETFILAVNCGQAGGSCFCASMKTGPKVQHGYDLALTEVIVDKKHFFVVEVGSDRGAEVLKGIQSRPADPTDIKLAEQIVKKAEKQMKRKMDTTNIRELLADNLEHPHWDDVAHRCLTCTNCTLVCPTCFCSTVEDTTDLSGEHAERWRRWDSCFTMQFAKVAGGNFRPSPKSRYRQWLTHKLSSWVDQFGVLGCVGCGRCITWCPVGIDITAEVKAIRESSSKTQQHRHKGA
jgi:sulfhydrogenase subunit beta (sulfur reductase)